MPAAGARRDRLRIHVEFYGVPRLRAGVAETVVELSEASAALGDLLRALAQRLPSLSGACIEGDHLRAGFVANLDGERFTRDPLAPLRDGQVILLMSADAGG